MSSGGVWWGTAIVALAGVLLVGCAAQQPAEFAREQTARDRPPAEPSDADSTIDAESTRFVGEAEGYDLYLARPMEWDDGICVVFVDASTDEWYSTACGAGDGVGAELPSGTRVEVGNFQYQDAAERTQLSDSVALLKG